MSCSSAPPRRSSKTSSTRLLISALVALGILAGLPLDPCRVPVVQVWVVDQAELLDVVVGPQVGGAFKDQLNAVLELQATHLGVRARRRQPPPVRGQELLRLLEESRIMLGEEVAADQQHI